MLIWHLALPRIRPVRTSSWMVDTASHRGGRERRTSEGSSVPGLTYVYTRKYKVPMVASSNVHSAMLALITCDGDMALYRTYRPVNEIDTWQRAWS